MAVCVSQRIYSDMPEQDPWPTISSEKGYYSYSLPFFSKPNISEKEPKNLSLLRKPHKVKIFSQVAI